MTDNYILASAERQAEIEAAKVAFFMSGGQVEEVESREVALPFRSERVEPETVLDRKREVRQQKPEQSDLAMIAKQAAKEAQIRMVRELATVMTVVQVQQETGLTTYALRNMARNNGFRFVNPCSVPDPVEDAANVLRIKSARDRGLSRHAARQELRMSSSHMQRLIESYAIDYPVHPAFDRSRKDAEF